MKEGTPNIGAVCQRLAKHAPSGLSAEQIAVKALEIASSICVFTNDHITVETIGG